MADVTPKYSKDEFFRRGQEIFECKIREAVEGEDPEKYVSIDIETGDFEVDANMLRAIHRLRRRNPMAQVWTRTVGSEYAFHFGGRPGSDSR